MQKPVFITAIQSISPLGNTTNEIWKNYNTNTHFLSLKKGNVVAQLSAESKTIIEHLKVSDAKYKSLDDSVLFAIHSARQAIQQARWNPEDNFGVNVGSSRGATALFEHYHKAFLNRNKAETLTSPTTTLGNISSWIAHDLQTKGPEISHSITCSTALHSMLNGIAWLQAGMATKFLVGGSEAPLTPFTIAQMQALKIYCHSEQSEKSYPCQALNLEKTKNTMVLGEGAAMACLELEDNPNSLAKIIGVGYATEVLEHNVSLSAEAICFQKSMQMALGDINPDEIDAIVTHTPGTIKGDIAEINAINTIFCNKTPALTTNKWKLGHSLGASGLLSIEMAVMMLQNQKFIAVPYLQSELPKSIKKIIVNAVGFGGNAVSILLSK
ncbi:beta-ketoacyl synthase N-terminal-like domain-containing protein [Lacinutrix salivirga]